MRGDVCCARVSIDVKAARAMFLEYARSDALLLFLVVDDFHRLHLFIYLFFWIPWRGAA